MLTWSHLGSQGSKGHFQYKCYNSSMLNSMTIRLMHVHQLETLYLYYGSTVNMGLFWGHRGQKVIFNINVITRPCYIAAIRVIHLHQLETFYFFMGSNVNLGSFGVTWVKRTISMKIFITRPCYIA